MSKYTIKEQDNNIIVEGLKDFDLEQTLECGQCFHFYKIEKEDYIVIAYNKMLHIKQTQVDEDNIELILFNTTRDDFESVWRVYFDLDRDYGQIKKFLLEKDDTLVEAIKQKHGIRILSQEFSETLMSFIISQTKQIPQIKQVVKHISDKYGNYVGEYEGTKYYAFPDIDALKKISEEQFRECKTGFRAAYLSAAAKYLSESMNNDYFSKYTYEEAKKELTSIKGVGEKVANCVLLFSLGYRNAFPVDVWIKRTMEELYFGEETSPAKIMEFAKDRFGEYGGYAQQYLFFFGKTSNLKGKKNT